MAEFLVVCFQLVAEEFNGIPSPVNDTLLGIDRFSIDGSTTFRAIRDAVISRKCDAFQIFYPDNKPMTGVFATSLAVRDEVFALYPAHTRMAANVRGYL